MGLGEEMTKPGLSLVLCIRFCVLHVWAHSRTPLNTEKKCLAKFWEVFLGGKLGWVVVSCLS